MSLRLFPIILTTGLTLMGSAAFGQAETLRLGGTGSGLGLLQRLGQAYGNEHPDVTVEIVPGLGSSGGIAALADGMIDLAVSSRKLKPGETDKGLRETATARTPFLLVTSQHNPSSLKAADVAAAFRDESPVWPNGEAIRVIIRPESESDTGLLKASFTGMPEALDIARARSEIPVATTDQDNAMAAEGIKGSLAGATLVQIVTEGRALRAIPIDGIEPSLENIEAGRYPYGKTLHFVIPAKPSAAAEGFAAFLVSEAAAPLMRKSGILPAAP